MDFHKNDKVVVLSGDNAGTVSRVLQVLTKKDRVIVEKVNFIKRHTKARGQGQQSGIIEKEAPIHFSKLAHFCDHCNRGVRIKVQGTSKSRTRHCVRCDSVITKG